MTTADIIHPIITSVYGKAAMADALAEHLVTQIDKHQYIGAAREKMIMDTCWIWFSGGDTATSVAREIETALVNAATTKETS